MRFESPWWLLALAVLALGLMARLILRQAGNWPRPAVLFANVSPLERQQTSWRIRLRFLPGLLNVFALILMIVALARPQEGRSESRVLSEGIDIMLLVDTSGSMAAEDFGGNRTRLWHATQVMQEFIQRRSTDRIGLISFGRHPYTRCPMTLDYGLLTRFCTYVYDEWVRAYDSSNKKRAMERNPRFTPQELDLQGTAIGDAVVAAVARFENAAAKSKIIILLTDGTSNMSETEPIASAEIAVQFGIKIYTIGAGSNERVPVSTYDAFGRPVKQFQGFPLDEETLKKMAGVSNGRYFRAGDRAQLEEVLREIDRLERSELEVKDYREWDEKWMPLLTAALILLMINGVLTATVLRTIP